MLERFTEKAIKVIMLAQEEARRLGHNFVGTEQILLGLIGEGTGVAAKVLKSMGVNLKDSRVEVEKIIGRGSGFVAVEIPFTPRAKRVLEISLEEVLKNANNETLLILQMESLEAYENIDEILKIPGYEVLLLGPTDLSASLGIPGDIHNSKVENIMIDVASKIKNSDKFLATTFTNLDDCERWIPEGYQMMNISDPLLVGTKMVSEKIKEYKEKFKV